MEEELNRLNEKYNNLERDLHEKELSEITIKKDIDIIKQENDYLKYENKNLHNENSKLVEENKFLRDLMENNDNNNDRELRISRSENERAKKKGLDSSDIPSQRDEGHSTESELDNMRRQLYDREFEKEQLLNNYRNEIGKLENRIRELEFNPTKRLSKLSHGSENLDENQVNLEREVEILRRENQELENIIKEMRKPVSSVRKINPVSSRSNNEGKEKC